MNMNFPLQVITHYLRMFRRKKTVNFLVLKIGLNAQTMLSIFFVVISVAAIAGVGLDARYESEHTAVHVSSQPHGQGWPVRQPGRKDEEETAHDAAL